jgi:hypothetical protein
MVSDSTPDEMVMRYLAAFGPATTSDVQTWCRLNGVRSVIERLQPRLRTFRDERGRELYDCPEAPLPDPETPVPPRFLPQYDNVFLSHADRTRIVTDEYRKRILGGNTGVRTFLVDGYIAGTWKISRAKDAATLVIAPFARLSPGDSHAVAEEGARLLAFGAKDATKHDVELREPD